MDSSLNEENHGGTLDQLVFLIPNNEVNQLHQHTRAYLQSIGQIPVIYQIPRARSSHRGTQPYSENETLASTIDDLIIDTISKIREPITTTENQEDPEFQNFLDFPEVDSTFHDFRETKVGGSRPPENNPTCTNPPYPRPNFSFLATMDANRPWLSADVIQVLGIQHPLPKHPEKILPKLDLDNDVTPEDHIKKFMLSLTLIDVQHEDVVCKLFP